MIESINQLSSLSLSFLLCMNKQSQAQEYQRMSIIMPLGRRIEICRENVDKLIDKQRRLSAMASDPDTLYSAVKLQTLVEQYRDYVKSKMLAFYSQTHLMGADATDELVLHAAAWLKVSSLNLAQLVQDYPNLICHKHRGVLPLHVVIAATGDDHFSRVRAILCAFPEGAKVLDSRGILPVQIALLSGAPWEVVKLLIDAFPSAIQYPFLPFAPVLEHNVRSLINLRPYEMACSLGYYDLSSLFQLLAKSQDIVITAASHSKSHE